jgi:hypothetical protein
MDLFGLKKSGDFPVAEGHGYPLVNINNLISTFFYKLKKKKKKTAT